MNSDLFTVCRHKQRIPLEEGNPILSEGINTAALEAEQDFKRIMSRAEVIHGAETLCVNEQALHLKIPAPIQKF